MNATVKSEVISGFERIRRRLANRPARPATGQRPRQRVAPSAPEKEIIREVARATAAFRDSEAGRALFAPGQTPLCQRDLRHRPPRNSVSRARN